MAKIKLLALGGQDERNKSCLIVEINDEIYVFNVGVKLPVNTVNGISLITIDSDYLKNRMEKIRGIFIGTPSFYNTTGLFLLLSKLKPSIPIYTNEVGEVVVKKLFESKHIKKSINPNIVVLQPGQDIDVGDNKVLPFRIANSMPNSYGWILKTEDGCIVFVDDFIVTNDRNKTFQSQLNNLQNYTKNNTLALIVGINQAGIPGFATPQHKNKSFYESIINHTEGKVIVGTHSNDAYTIFTLLSIAKQTNRPICIIGNTFLNVLKTTIEKGLFSSRKLIMITKQKAVESKNAIIIIADNPNTYYETMTKFIHNQRKNIPINENDRLILGVTVLPGQEMNHAVICDELSRLDINYKSLPKNIIEMKACDEDHKLLINLLQPKYVIPHNGIYKYEVKLNDALQSTWIKQESILTIDNGDVLNIVDGNLIKSHQKIELNDNYVSTNHALDVGESIIYERNQMGSNGVIAMSLVFDKAHQKLFNYVKLEYFGVVNHKDLSSSKVEEIEATFKKRMGECLVYENKKLNIKETKFNLKRLLSKLFEKKFNRRPLVLPTFIDYVA
ncbi:ribonuclease J [Ureaplasma canigenitalium]|uniref:ribonuclease J n=1 Tax=Ureaplasma canigenitalium TaxID=42092 RepID=UPI0004E18851|nr:ribonuclease J [Ureaplasma canigenitalium]